MAIVDRLGSLHGLAGPPGVRGHSMALRPRVATHPSAALAGRAAGALTSGPMAGSAIALCAVTLSTTPHKNRALTAILQRVAKHRAKRHGARGVADTSTERVALVPASFLALTLK